VKLNIPWHQYATIVYLTEQLQEKRQRFGKTALQKLIFLLQTVFKVPVGYQFTLYTHGPFCSELMDDLDYVNYIDGVSVSIDPDCSGYVISPASKAVLIKEKANDFLTTYRPQIEKLLAEFGSMRVKDLELRSTIIFVDRDAVNSGREISRNDFIQEIKSIKPHFSYGEIQKAITELEARSYIEKR